MHMPYTCINSHTRVSVRGEKTDLAFSLKGLLIKHHQAMATFQPYGPERYQPAHKSLALFKCLPMGFVHSSARRAQLLACADTMAKEGSLGSSGCGWVSGRSHKVPLAHWEARSTFIPFGKLAETSKTGSSRWNKRLLVQVRVYCALFSEAASIDQ